MKKILVLGSLNMDLSIHCDNLPKNGETLSGYDFFMNPGGKGGNQAVASSKLGSTTYMIGNVGDDLFGQQLTQKLNEYGVDTTYIHTSKDCASGVAVVICQDKDNRIILGHGANYTLEFDHVRKAIDELAQEGDLFLTQLENQMELVEKSLLYAKQKGLYTILNPAPAKKLSSEIYESLDMLIVNQTECELLTGIYPKDESDCIAALEFFEQKGVLTIITLGEEGSVIKTSDKLIKLDARKVDVVDTTGAGDSYIGALCAQLTKGESLIDSLKFAVDVAAVCVTRRGAQVSMPSLDEMKEYKEEENE